MIRSLYRTIDGRQRLDLQPSEFAAALQEPDSLLWVDFQAEPPERCEPILSGTFHFHPLAIEDALHQSHVPKLDDWGEYLYLVLHGIVFAPDDSDPVKTLELDIFFGPNYVVTHHDGPIAAIDRVWTLSHRDERHLVQGADHLLYRLADELVAGYMPLVEEMDTAIDRLEDQILISPNVELLEHILSMKRGLHHVRRTIAPQREVLNKLARDDFRVIDADDRVFFRDVYDHLVRLHDINESMRDLVGDALDTYLSVVSNRMNDIVKTLTIITTLFMPISFIGSFFGMNFFQPIASRLLPWTDVPVFVLTLVLLIFTPAAMYLWIRGKGWMQQTTPEGNHRAPREKRSRRSES